MQTVRINTFYSFPKKIAEHLKFFDWTSYTVYCVPKSSATMLIDNETTIPDLKRLGKRASTSFVKGYMRKNIQTKIQTSKKIFRNFNQH